MSYIIRLKTILKKLLKKVFRFVLVLVVLILIGYIFLYVKQEKFYFNPKVLTKDYTYSFDRPFKEENITVDTNTELNTLLFKTDSISKGVILYLHGNAGALHDWGKRAYLYNENGYDVFFVDYRGYGKSDGFYSKEEQLYHDMDIIYNHVKKQYKEDNITILGYSLGSGLAAYLASKNKPRQLILESPYYGWKELVSNMGPFPTFMINYDIPTYQFIKKVRCPIRIFVGSRDYLTKANENAIPLKNMYPNKIELFTIEGVGHNGIFYSKMYYDVMKKLLN